MKPVCPDLDFIVKQPIAEDDNCEIYTVMHPGSIYPNMRLPNMSAEVHEEFMFDSGSSDMSYEDYKRRNNMIDMTDFNGDATQDLLLVLEDGFRQRRIVFKAVYDSDWENEGMNELTALDSSNEATTRIAEVLLAKYFGGSSYPRRVVLRLTIDLDIAGGILSLLQNKYDFTPEGDMHVDPVVGISVVLSAQYTSLDIKAMLADIGHGFYVTHVSHNQHLDIGLSRLRPIAMPKQLGTAPVMSSEKPETAELLTRLKTPSSWARGPYRPINDSEFVRDSAPFEAASEIECLLSQLESVKASPS
jgi:hypothetical protein